MSLFTATLSQITPPNYNPSRNDGGKRAEIVAFYKRLFFRLGWEATTSQILKLTDGHYVDGTARCHLSRLKNAGAITGNRKKSAGLVWRWAGDREMRAEEIQATKRVAPLK